MHRSIKTIVKRLGRAAGWLGLAALVSGCHTYRTVDGRFMSQPAAHRRVQVLPVWFAGAGNVDHSLTTNEIQALCRQTGEGLSTAIRDTLGAKGYQVTGPVKILSGDKTSPGLDAETRLQLEIIRIDFGNNLLRPYPPDNPDQPLTLRTNAGTNPFHHQMTSPIARVAIRLGGTNAAAVLLVDTKIFFESRHNQAKRLWWNWTGGGVIAVTEVGVNLAVLAAAVLAGASSAPGPIWIDPFWHSDNSIQHSIALVDIRTQEVLWLNRQDFKHQDPGDPEILMKTVAGTLADLPPINQP
jgi:hypothetical protein